MIWKGPGLLPDEMWPAREPLVSHRFLQLSDGERARVVESGSGGDPVLFLHGWGASVYQFRRNLIPVGGAGHRALAVDLRGHGLSDKPLRGGAYTLDAMTAHVLRFMDGLDLERVTLVGMSMGGRIALELALTSPDRIERVALIDPIGLGVLRVRRLARLASIPPLDPIMPYLMRRALIRLGLRSIHGRASNVSEEDVEEYWAPARFPSFARALFRLMREFSWEPLEEERLRELQTPALVMFGTLDKLVIPDPAGPLLQPREGYDVRYVEGAGHVANEELADEVNAALLAFLSGEEVPASRKRVLPSEGEPRVGGEVDEDHAVEARDGVGPDERADEESHEGEGRGKSARTARARAKRADALEGQEEPGGGSRKKRRRGKQPQKKGDEDA